MTTEIRPLTADDLPALSRFLTAGFGAAADAEFAAEDVLRWKYLDPSDGEAESRSLIALDEAGAIVGHVGFAPTVFTGPGVARPVSGLQMTDWLGSAGHRTVGVSLMRRVHAATEVQFGLGGSDAALAVALRGVYQAMTPAAVYERVLRPFRRLKAAGLAPKTAARAGRDLARGLVRPRRPVAVPLDLEPIAAFGPEVSEIVAAAARHAVVAARTPERLNHLLRHPRRAASAFLLRAPDGTTRGLAILTTLPRAGTTQGRVVDLLLDDAEPATWHAAWNLLAAESKRMGADALQAFASPSWTSEGLDRAGFVRRYPLAFSLRDRRGLLPHDVPFYLTAIEADYAFLP